MREEEISVLKRQPDGNKIMVCAAFSAYGKSILLHIKGSLNSMDYVQLLRENSLPWEEEKLPTSWLFQQENESAPYAKATQKWLKNRVYLMKWPA